MEADAAAGKAAINKDKIVAIQEAVEEEAAAEEEKVAEEDKMAEEVVVEAMPKMEKAAASEKKEKAEDVAVLEKKDRAAAAKTTEDSAVATPVPGVGMPDRQAGPVGGMEEFNDWVQRNIKYPEEVLPRVRQVIVVTFKVAADSTIYDLKAERTPGELFTAEVFQAVT